MLLFLVLVLLFGPACSAQEIQGAGFGSYFYIKGEEQGEIQGIRVFVGILGLIKGIQLRFGSRWSPRYGAPGGRAQEFLLQEGERVTAVDGSARACIWHLRWTTSRGRRVSFGRAAGTPFSARTPFPGQQLLTANGQHWFFCLSGIGFKWGFAPKNLSSQAPTVAPQELTTGLGKVSETSPPFPPGFPFSTL